MPPPEALDTPPSVRLPPPAVAESFLQVGLHGHGSSLKQAIDEVVILMREESQRYVAGRVSGKYAAHVEQTVGLTAVRQDQRWLFGGDLPHQLHAGAPAATGFRHAARGGNDCVVRVFGTRIQLRQVGGWPREDDSAFQFAFVLC